MKIKVINIVSSVNRINIGVWSVVISTFESLVKLGVESELISLGSEEKPDEVPNMMGFNTFNNYSGLVNYLKKHNKETTLIVSHGNWTFSTKAGHELASNGYKWIFVPHGMLEPWSFRHKALKKKLYYNFVEKAMLEKADGMVAVGGPEYENLSKLLPDLKCDHIPNGIQIFDGSIERKYQKINFLYLARLHKKKRPVELTQSWIESSLHNKDRFQLILAGPDEGELSYINKLVLESSSTNIHPSKPVYGNEKRKLLLDSHFFILPSISEGFPTTIIESMTHGCIPIISKGCNFPEAIKSSVAVDIPYSIEAMSNTLESMAFIDSNRLEAMSLEGKKFADTNYSVDIVSKELQKLYHKVLTTSYP